MMGNLWRKRRRAAEATAILAVTLLAFAALRHLADEVHIRDIRSAFHGIGWAHLWASLGFTMLSYFLLTLYDVMALRVIHRPLPYRTAALASLTSYTLSHNLGFGLLTGGSARYRVYMAAGISPPDILRVIATTGLAFWSGVFVTAGVALLFHPASFALGPLVVSPDIQRYLGGGILAVFAVILLLLRRRGGGPVTLLRWTLPRPSAGQALAQTIIAALDLAAASAAMLVLVPGAGVAQLPLLFLGYALAMVAGLVSHVPGGIGVFEAVIVAVFPQSDRPALLAALILYRVIYYLVPLAVAAVLLAIHERRRLRSPVAATLNAAQLIVRGIAPTFIAAMVFLGGTVLLISGSLPALPWRLAALRHVLPLPFVEASHIAASLVGTGLLLLAPALYRRLDAAFLLTRALLLAGAFFSLAKGFDYEEAVILFSMAAALQIARPAFYRRTALTSALGSPGSIVAIAVCASFSIWIGLFAFRHVDYQNDLWWEFAWNGDASRFLRATLAIAVAFVCVSVMRLFGHAGARVEPMDTDLTTSEVALSRSSRTDAFLALTGDKRFLHAASGEALLMYQVQGQSWIVMGDPVGAREEWPDLLWRIREMADAAQGRLLLYQITMAAVPMAIDLGLQLVKYGEEARVDLSSFSLDGSDMKALRHAERRAIREGASFEIIPAAAVPHLMSTLRIVSDEWLAAKRQAEKAFSIGRFDPAYLARFDCAVVRQHGVIVAFANIWATGDREELSVDLMRHGVQTPYGAMDYLFVSLMKWGRDQGYRWFNLGLAPLSGIEARRLAPIWARVGGLLYRHGDAFYSFEGLRAYKEKFAPCWEPRYIAAPHGLGLARALLDLQTLIGGGSRSAAAARRLRLAA